MRKSVLVFFLLCFTAGFAPVAQARLPYIPKEKHKSKKKKNKKKDTKAESADKPAENQAAPEPVKTRAQLKKERKEQRRKEKEARKEQRRKEKAERRDKKKHKTPAAAATTPDGTGVIRKWADIDYPQSIRKTHYRIDFLAPLYLDELVRNGYPVKDIPEKALPGLNFYKGVQIAADSLKKAGFDIDIYVHDVASLLESSEMLVRKNAMDSTDLIIGAVDGKDVSVLAGYAKAKKINFVSATSSYDAAARENPYFTILEPSLPMYCRAIAENWNKKGKNKPLLLYRSFPIYNDNAYKTMAEAALSQKSEYSSVVCNTIPPREALNPYIDSTGSNVIAMPISDQKFTDSLLKTIRRYYPSATFTIYGLPGWSAMPGLTVSGAYPKMNILVPAAFVYNDKLAVARYIAQVYKREYGGKPQDGVYRGYETLYWYANLLKRYGTLFNKQYADNETAPFTSFEVKPHWDNAGNAAWHENKHIYFRSYFNGIAANMEEQ